MQSVAIYGSGGFAREVAWLARSIAGSGAGEVVACFIDDDASRVGQEMNGRAIRSLADLVAAREAAPIAIAIGSPKVRQQLAERIAAAGLRFASLVHPGVLMSESVAVGEAAIICAGNILTTDIVLGDHVQINLGCTVGHDVVMEDFATLAPGVHVSGNVVIRKGAYIGTGAVIINGSPSKKLEIGEGAVVGAGACVVKNVPAGLTVGGVPAKPLHAAA